MKQKLFALAMALVLALGMLTACGGGDASSQSAGSGAQGTGSSVAGEDKNYNETGLPIVNETITISVMGYKDGGSTEWNELELFQRAEAATGIHFDFELYDDVTIYDDKMNLAITTGGYPDVFMRRMDQVYEEANGRDGIFIDLTELIENHMPNLSKMLDENPEVRAAITASDGAIYSLPYYYKTATGNPHQVFMFDGWLHEAGFEDVPETVDEFYDLLVALNELDINGNGTTDDDIPLGAWDVNILQKYLIPAFTGYARADFTNTNILDVDDNGKVVCVPMEEGYKEFLEYTAKLFAEGLLDNEIYTQNVDQWLAKLKENRIGVFNASPTATDPEMANGTAISLKPLTSATNATPVCEVMPNLGTGAAVITNKCENPEAVARWFDLFYSPDDESQAGLNGCNMFAGFRGEHWDFTDESETQYYYIDPITSAPDLNATVTVNMWLPGYLEFEYIPTGSPLFEQKVAGVIENQIPYMRTGLPINYIRLNEEESAVREQVQLQANDYAKQMTAQFITGVADIETGYDAFVANLEAMGIQDLIDAYQSAYDRFDAAASA